MFSILWKNLYIEFRIRRREKTGKFMGGLTGGLTENRISCRKIRRRRSKEKVSEGYEKESQQNITSIED